MGKLVYTSIYNSDTDWITRPEQTRKLYLCRLIMLSFPPIKITSTLLWSLFSSEVQILPVQEAFVGGHNAQNIASAGPERAAPALTVVERTVSSPALCYFRVAKRNLRALRMGEWVGLYLWKAVVIFVWSWYGRLEWGSIFAGDSPLWRYCGINRRMDLILIMIIIEMIITVVMKVASNSAVAT